MTNNAKSFFDRLTGNSIVEDNETEGEEKPEKYAKKETTIRPVETQIKKEETKQEWLEEDETAQLTLDMYQTPTEIIVQTMVAGVMLENIDVSINQDMLTIHGKRQQVKESSEDSYYYKELYWGGFSRSVLLPQEVDVDGISATIKNGLMTIRLPKINKEKIQKIKVKSAE